MKVQSNKMESVLDESESSVSELTPDPDSVTQSLIEKHTNPNGSIKLIGGDELLKIVGR